MKLQPLGISTKQRKKLLEMGKSLYPTFIFKWVDTYDHQGLVIEKDDEEWYWDWFEFVLTYLKDKLLSHRTFTSNFSKDTLQLIDGIQALMYGGENGDQVHPVDFLYNKFKEL